MAHGAQPRFQLPCGRHQRRDLRVCVDVWRDPRATRGQKILRGNLARGVDRRQMASEATRNPEPLAPAVRVRIRWHPRPRKRQLGGDPLSANLLEELDEPFKQPAVLGHLEPEPAADLQIVPEGFTKRAHATPPWDGHWRASARSALRSTFAYFAVVFCSRWRSTWPISASDAPALSISVAAVCRSRCAPTLGRPARLHAARTTHPTVPLFSSRSGALTRKNSARHSHRGRRRR